MDQSIQLSDLLVVVIRYAVTLLGSVTMYIFTFSRGFKGSMSLLKRLFPKRSQVFYDRLDFLLVVLLGSLVGTVFFSPQNNFQALAAGCGWIGAVTVLLNRNTANEVPKDD